MNIFMFVIIVIILITGIYMSKKHNYSKSIYFVSLMMLIAIGLVVVNYYSNNDPITAVSYYNENNQVRSCELPAKGKLLKSDAVSSSSYKIKNKDVDKVDELIQYSFVDNGITYDFITCEGEYIQYKRVDDIITISENISFDSAANGDVILYIAPRELTPVVGENTISIESNTDSIIKIIESKYNLKVEKNMEYTFNIKSEYIGSEQISFTYDGEKITYLPVT